MIVHIYYPVGALFTGTIHPDGDSDDNYYQLINYHEPEYFAHMCDDRD